MKELPLVEVKVEKITFINDVQVPEAPGTIDVRIGTEITTLVKFNQTNTKCKCETTVELVPVPKVNFGATIVVVGIFDCDGIQDRKKIHLDAFKKLFPHVQATTSGFMNMMGFPNFFIEEPEMDVNKIVEENDE